MLSLAVLFPIIAGFAMFFLPLSSRRMREIVVEGVTLATSALVFLRMFQGGGEEIIFYLTDAQPIGFMLDGVGSVFTAIVAFLWPLSVLYAFEYMEHVGGEKHFFAIYTITYGVTLGISTSANVMTLYLFYEFLTLCTMPLVMHGTKRDAVRAGHQYMIYSFFGAAIAFVGVMLCTYNGGHASFAMGGVLNPAFTAEQPLAVQIGYLCMLLGFGVKAAMFPLHAWLPIASVAPTPVTALLHAVAVVKSGVFSIIRVTYFLIGAQILRGTPAQNIALALASITIVYGSTMAVREHHFKRRLAYSTISNLSYIIMAVSLMTAAGLAAGLAHMLFHALIKITLFFTAGAVLVRTERTQIESLRGLSSVMPKICVVYTVAALALMGMPMLPGFVSKWMIGVAAVAHATPMAYVGAIAVLISAVLTAIYLMSVVVAMYFRPLEEGHGAVAGVRNDPSWKMLLPLYILVGAIVLCGLFSNNVTQALTAIASGVV